MDYTLPPLTTEELVAMWDAGVENGSYYKADTLDDLAKQTGLDAEKLKAVVARYNELCDKGEDEDFHKNPDFMVKIGENGPFYAAQNYACLLYTSAICAKAASRRASCLPACSAVRQRCWSTAPSRNAPRSLRPSPGRRRCSFPSQARLVAGVPHVFRADAGLGEGALPLRTCGAVSGLRDETRRGGNKVAHVEAAASGREISANETKAHEKSRKRLIAIAVAAAVFLFFQFVCRCV